VIAKMILTKTS